MRKKIESDYFTRNTVEHVIIIVSKRTLKISNITELKFKKLEFPSLEKYGQI